MQTCHNETRRTRLCSRQNLRARTQETTTPRAHPESLRAHERERDAPHTLRTTTNTPRHKLISPSEQAKQRRYKTGLEFRLDIVGAFAIIVSSSSSHQLTRSYQTWLRRTSAKRSQRLRVARRLPTPTVVRWARTNCRSTWLLQRGRTALPTARSKRAKPLVAGSGSSAHRRGSTSQQTPGNGYTVPVFLFAYSVCLGARYSAV